MLDFPLVYIVKIFTQLLDWIIYNGKLHLVSVFLSVFMSTRRDLSNFFILTQKRKVKGFTLHFNFTCTANARFPTSLYCKNLYTTCRLNNILWETPFSNSLFVSLYEHKKEYIQLFDTSSEKTKMFLFLLYYYLYSKCRDQLGFL